MKSFLMVFSWCYEVLGNGVLNNSYSKFNIVKKVHFSCLVFIISILQIDNKTPYLIFLIIVRAKILQRSHGTDMTEITTTREIINN